MAPPVTPNEARFWAAVEVGEEDECWLWTGSVDKDGYGWFSWNKGKGNNISISAPRFSLMMKLNNYELTFEEKTKHSCDNPKCCNPKHLSVGDAQSNSNEMVARNRSCKGEKNHSSLLTDAQRKEILEQYKKPHNAYGWNIAMGKKYGVDKQVIRRLVAGLTASHLQ